MNVCGLEGFETCIGLRFGVARTVPGIEHQKEHLLCNTSELGRSGIAVAPS